MCTVVVCAGALRAKKTAIKMVSRGTLRWSACLVYEMSLYFYVTGRWCLLHCFLPVPTHVPHAAGPDAPTATTRWKPCRVNKSLTTQGKEAYVLSRVHVYHDGENCWFAPIVSDPACSRDRVADARGRRVRARPCVRARVRH